MIDSVSALWAGGVQVFSGPALVFLFAGVIIGYVVGLVPGIGGPTAMALLLPSTFALETVSACALLTGVAASTVTAGEITSILLGVPGEATSAAMLADGHQLATRGEGARAAGAAVTASLAGGVIGALVLAVSMPIARVILGEVASPELLMLALLGILLVAPVSARAPLKGLIAGAMGLALATVGLDPSNSTPRLTLGHLFLWDGVGLLSIALGLFAIPEAVRLVSEPAPAAVAPPSGGMARAGVRDTMRHWRLVLRCSGIGTAIGVLPGVGAMVSQWLAYGHAAHGSSRRRHFGTGEIEGVIGPGAASNATLGGDFVPTLALGIPGSLPTAIVLGALVLKGLTPGPAMLLPDHLGGQLPLVFSFVWMIVLGNAVAAAISFWFLDRLSAIARITPALLFPVVMTFVPIGVYAERQAAGDLLITAIVGAAGCAMARYDWPRAPLLLGLVLGPLLERRLLLTMDAYGWSWIWRPGVLLLAAAGLLLVHQMRRHGDGPPRGSAADGPGNALVAAAAVAVGLAGLWGTRDLAAPASVLPRVAFGAVAALGTLQACRRWGTAATAASPRGRETFAMPLAVGWTLPFVLGPIGAGFAISTFVAAGLYLVLSARAGRGRALTIAAALAGGVAVLQAIALPVARLGWW